MYFLERISELPPAIAKMVLAMDEAGGAVLVFDRDDRIMLANREQRRIMPCCDYTANDTYSSLFWSLFENKMIGNPVARKSPSEWLAGAIGARHNSPNLDFVNCYDWGRMLVSHLRLDDGTSIQARLDMRAAGMERYFEGPEASMGVTRALRLRREIRNLEAALDTLGLAVALVDGLGCILHANSSFSEMLEAADGVTNLNGHHIAAVDRCDGLVLQQALSNVCAGMLPVAYVPIRRRHGDPFLLAVSAGATPGTAILALARFGEDLGEIAAALRQALGVTPAEADVMVGLGAGRSIAELSLHRGVSTATTYQQIHAVKGSLRRNRFAAPDLPGIAGLVTGIAAITRTPSARKH